MEWTEDMCSQELTVVCVYVCMCVCGGGGGGGCNLSISVITHAAVLNVAQLIPFSMAIMITMLNVPHSMLHI